MTERSAVAVDAARRFWAHDGKLSAPDEVSREVERVCLELGERLVRWIGPHGYDVLLNRALAATRAEHPALAGMTCRGGDGPIVTEAVLAHGAPKVGSGIVTLLATVIDLLGRIVGEELAVKILEQPGGRRPRDTESGARGGLDG